MKRVARLAGPVVAAGLLLVSCSSTFGMPAGGDAQGHDISNLWRVFFWASLCVAAIVYGLIAWSIVRYRRRGREDLPPQFRGHVALEVVYTSIPVAIVIALFAITYRGEDRVLGVASDPAVTVHVEAYAWGWRFGYEDQRVTIATDPSGAPPQLVLPTGQTVRIVLTSEDVIHAFYVPGFLFKRDAIPGRTSVFDLDPETLGIYQGECAEFCGLNHAFMRFTVRVVTPSEFETWVGQQQASGGIP